MSRVESDDRLIEASAGEFMKTVEQLFHKSCRRGPFFKGSLDERIRVANPE